MDKKALRRVQLAARSSLSAEFVEAASRLIRQHIIDYLRLNDFAVALIFTQHGNEPAIAELAENHPQLTWAFPVVSASQGKMEFYRWQHGDSLHKNRYGILEPEASPERLVVPNDQSICFLPALAVDARGGRLGFGGGYYDRYLARYQMLQAIGVVFDRFLLETVPTETHDKLLVGIISEKNFFRCQADPT